VTKTLNIHGYHENAERFGDLWWYGTDAVEIEAIIRADPTLGQKLHPDLAIKAAEVVWAARSEMARTVEDVLSRRTRSLLLGAKAAIECAPKVAAIMAKELKRDQAWQKSQVELFTQLPRISSLTAQLVSKTKTSTDDTDEADMKASRTSCRSCTAILSSVTSVESVFVSSLELVTNAYLAIRQPPASLLGDAWSPTLCSR
jgi:hypothetical protein